MPPAIGIDLGATHSCVAVCQNGVTTIIENRNGDKVIPSYVTFDTPSDAVVGHAASAKVGKNTVFYSKCLIGLKFPVPDDVKDYVHEDLPCSVTVRDQKPYFQLDFNGEEKLVDPTFVSSKVLACLKEIAEDHLGCQVEDAAIAIPATFLQDQREATRAAGKAAGFKTIELIHEPTAAAVAYGLETDVDCMNILIFDLGAANLDVSVLALQDKEFRVLGTSGMSRFGGIFFDRRVVDYVSEEFMRQKGQDLNDDQKNRLRIACAKAKRDLDSANETIIKVENSDFQITLSRVKFNALNGTLFDSIIPSIQDALANGKIHKSNIQRIVLVGGSSRICRIQELIADFFAPKQPDISSLEPGEAIAYGAAVKAAILCGEFDENEPSIVEIASRSIGIETVGGIMNAIITQDMTIPTEQTQMFSTSQHNQTVVTIKVFEGEERETKDNNFLGTFDLRGIPPAPRGVPKIQVTLELDANGILNVSASDKRAGQHGKIQIVAKKR